ncbi:MAG: prepilin peptidase [Lachnospiraceae bacterium]
MFDISQLGMNLATFTVALFFVELIYLAVIDQLTMEIPFVFQIVILLLGVTSIFTIGGLTIWERIIGMFCVSLPLLLITIIIPNAFGGGDIKLMFTCGFFLGWKLILVSFFFGIIFGGLFGAIFLLTKKKGRKEHFAFGPYLSVGMIVATLWGNQLLEWYLGSFKIQ